MLEQRPWLSEEKLLSYTNVAVIKMQDLQVSVLLKKLPSLST
jgi:hypothetical protein